MDLEKVAAAAKEYDEQQIANQEAAEREANKTIFDRIGDAVDSVNETVSEVFDFDAARFKQNVALRTAAPVFFISAATGEGIDALCGWLRAQMKQSKGGENGRD